jgi:hypothetical protein
MVNEDAIPQWNVDGVLPPCDMDDPISDYRSPYSVSLTDCILRFGTTQARRAILEGFMKFRSALHSVNLTKGFQWIDGSFLENVEEIEKRDPHDIDLVTFYCLPDGITEIDLVDKAPHLFDPERTKEDFHVDAYFVRLNTEDPELLVDQVAYWYSIWSHRRNGLWKGFLQIDLSSNGDQIAASNLEEMIREGGSL